MGLFRKTYEMMKAGAISHAKWDMEVSTSIIKNRKMLFIIGILLLPILVVGTLEASDILGGKSAYAPAMYTLPTFMISIAVGLIAGLITGCIGAGGGFIITPALMAAGVKGIMAVGTDLFHIFAKGIMGTTVHKKLGNVSVALAIPFLVGSGIGVTVGGGINSALYNSNPILSELFISSIYAVLLGFLGFYALFDFLKSTRGPNASSGDAHGGGEDTSTSLSVAVQKINVPPMITFDQDLVPGGRRISGLVLACGGFIVGLCAAIMGVGGGFITFPMFVYVFGVSSMTTVGTDIFQIIFTAGYGALKYAADGYVFYTLAMGMLLGSLIGIQVGALTTKVVKGIHIRGFYAVSILAGFINRAATLPKQLVGMKVIDLPAGLVHGIELVGTVIFWGVVGVFGLWVFGKFFANIKKLRGEA